MASRFRILGLIKSVSLKSVRYNVMSTSAIVPKHIKTGKEYRTENKLTYLEDPDKFGTLSTLKPVADNQDLDDEDDIKEQEFTQDLPLPTRKLTIKQYADIIKQYLEQKRLKEAIDVLEVRMLKQDRVKPENYIYNILIGGCADVGYTKKAFKLFNDMKRRALQPTGDTYTCLFQACINSPWAQDGLKNAYHLKSLMEEKGIEANLTNFNVMIKAFGRCGDLPMAFTIVDDMISKRIKIRVHTFNHLLHACITDKENGLRHALIVWRKMLKMREKPNIYSFNLMLKCVKECNLGSNEDIEELLGTMQMLQIEMNGNTLQINQSHQKAVGTKPLPLLLQSTESSSNMVSEQKNVNELVVTENKDMTIEFVDRVNKPVIKVNERTVPNLLSKHLNMEQVLSLQQVHTLQDKFAMIGGHDDFLKEMEHYSVKPDIKIFSQMVPLIEDTREAEEKLLISLKEANIKPDIDFYNMLIKKRCMRSDYDGAFDVKNIIEKDRKKRNPLKKKHALKLNVMTYGTLALACDTKEKAESLLKEMEEAQLKVNMEILGALLRQGTAHNDFGYVLYIMDLVTKENLKVNDVFLKHLEIFDNKCTNKTKEGNRANCSNTFKKGYSTFVGIYEKWLKDINATEVLQTEHPWKQFNVAYPDTLQRQNNFTIEEPKRFYKRKRKYVKYTPRL